MKDLAESSLAWNYWNLEARCYYFLYQLQHHRPSHEEKKKKRKKKQENKKLFTLSKTIFKPHSLHIVFLFII